MWIGLKGAEGRRRYIPNIWKLLGVRWTRVTKGTKECCPMIRNLLPPLGRSPWTFMGHWSAEGTLSITEQKEPVTTAPSLTRVIVMEVARTPAIANPLPLWNRQHFLSPQTAEVTCCIMPLPPSNAINRIIWRKKKKKLPSSFSLLISFLLFEDYN